MFGLRENSGISRVATDEPPAARIALTSPMPASYAAGIGVSSPGGRGGNRRGLWGEGEEVRGEEVRGER
jgi:hypothetical protein